MGGHVDMLLVWLLAEGKQMALVLTKEICYVRS